MIDDKVTLVTGAGGFIGGWLAETLFMKGKEVRAGVHDWSGAVRPARFLMDITPCDIMKPEQLNCVIAGVDNVVHCAYGSADVTVEGTRNILNASHQLGVERFVYMSTAEVYGNVNGVIDENFPYQYTGNSYVDSKIEAEKLCWQYYKRGLPVTIIRPSIVYGPFGRTWTIELARNLQSGNWGILDGHGDGICNLIYVLDLVDGILLTLQHEGAVGEAFNFNGVEQINWNEYFNKFNEALDLPKLAKKSSRATKIQTLLMEPVRRAAKFAKKNFESQIRSVAKKSRVVKSILKSAEQSLKTTPRLDTLSLYSRQAYYSAEKAQTMLGYFPRFNLEKGLDLSVRWLEHVSVIQSNGKTGATNS
jgi:nucleoside-diphosphate-sugar epimerase